MNEHSFIRSIHRRLPQELYVWKINDNYAGGVADAYYSGAVGDLWIEYKYLPKLPVRGSSKVKIDTSLQQRLWLDARYQEGRNVALIVGSPEGCLILIGPDMQIDHLLKDDFISRAVDRDDVIAFISGTTARH